MPGGDRTGPLGQGPGTGRAMGFCSGYGGPGSASAGPGRGAFGRGRGWRNWFNATGLTGRERAAALPQTAGPGAAQAAPGRFESVLEQILNRLTALETAAKRERGE